MQLIPLFMGFDQHQSEGHLPEACRSRGYAQMFTISCRWTVIAVQRTGKACSDKPVDTEYTAEIDETREMMNIKAG